MKKILWILASIILGELALALLTTVAQEVIFNGIDYHESPLWELIVGGLLTVLAAIGAGWVARKVIRRNNKIVPMGISILILIETYYLVFVRGSDQPMWFECFAVTSLISGVWIGFLLPSFRNPHTTGD